MRIGFVFTNFNNSLLTIQSVKSIEDNRLDVECRVVIVDNDSTCGEKQILAEAIMPSFVKILWNKNNIGYFSGLNSGLDDINDGDFDCDLIIIGNNDLVFDEVFFKSICNNYHKMINHSVVCPSILTIDGVYQNPHLFKEVGRLREFVWDLFYSNYFLSELNRVKFFYFY